MSLDLDARQRAMLTEMGITVWAPAPVAPAAVQAAPAPAAQPAAPVRAAAVHAPPPPGAAGVPQTTAPAAPRPAAPVQPTAAAPAGGARMPEATGPVLRLHAPQPLYPQADPAATPAELGSGWLVIGESPSPEGPLSGDTGKLLDNMLRAMRLHRHPRAHFSAVERAAPGAVDGPEDAAAALQAAIATLRPAMVLVLGLPAARAVLGSREPLGRLRATAHQLPDGTPAVVTYDPAYLLRAPEAKAAAWADLCRALAHVRAAAPASPAAGH
ncbi:uracil-DNA glycosylase family protein [Paracidovorax cattleyae]|uniref:DNA polymerase n=1 Tax=Paracidovorax cattleyae TaxID=80868 RepID=A0A1H0PH51_9BURK|nr:uracil-DNA glycosylase family protein [Paracidovorax cattleyae]SDP04009.1 DNA polymerase [Paracidovorax cattleyae]